MTTPTRHIIAMDGGGFSMEPENPALERYVLRQARRANPRVCFIATATATATGDATGYIDAFYSAFVPELLKKSLNEVAGSSAVSDRYKPLGKKHERFVERRHRRRDGSLQVA